MSVTARIAVASDLDDVLPVLRAARADSPLGAQLVNPDSRTLATQLHTWFELDGSNLVIAESDGHIIGLALTQVIATTLFADARHVQIEALYVAGAHRRRGAGHALMTQIAQVAAQHEAELVLTMPMTGARSEQRFLSGLGFSAAGSRRIAETPALLRRLELPAGSRERRGRGLDELIARRRRIRGLPPTPPRGLALGQFPQASPHDGLSNTMHVSRDVQTRRPDPSATAIS